MPKAWLCHKYHEAVAFIDPLLLFFKVFMVSPPGADRHCLIFSLSEWLQPGGLKETSPQLRGSLNAIKTLNKS